MITRGSTKVRISAFTQNLFFGFQWQNLAEILSLFKKYNNLGKVPVREKVWLIRISDYALWTLGWLDGLVEKSSFPFHRSDYLCRESVNAAITHLFCRKCRIYVFFCRKCRDYALFGVEFYAEFLAEILKNTQNFGRKSAENIGWWSLWVADCNHNQSKKELKPCAGSFLPASSTAQDWFTGLGCSASG